MDPLQWMDARVQTADKNITIIHTIMSVNVLWSEKLHACNKFIKTFNFKLGLCVFALRWIACDSERDIA